MASHVYDTPSDDESADNASPIDLDSRDTAGKGVFFLRYEFGN